MLRELRVLGCLSFVGIVLCCLAMPAGAAVIDIGGGWEASWDSSLDPYVDINSLGVVGDAVFIQKSAQFTQGPVNGIFPSIPIIFQQTTASAVSNIVIDDEIILNSTGADWTDFHLDLLDGQDVAFDPAATLAAGGGGPLGWSIAPFTQAQFSGDLQRLDITGGTVSDGATWFPGDGASDGQLWINAVVQQSQPFTVCTLKATPPPEPGTLSLLALGTMAMIRRRKK